jgi:site-specific DNA-methyltransferase (adenine-specific)
VKPYFEDASVTLYHGDMREVLPALDVRADACITDPPYGETSLVWDRWPNGWVRAVADVTNALWCFGSMRMFVDRAAEFAGWKLSQDIVWQKSNGSSLAADRFRRVHEHAVLWYRGAWGALHHDTPRRPHEGPGKGTAHRQGQPHHLGTVGDGVWVDNGTRLMESVIEARSMWRRGAVHPTQKPTAILDPLIRYSIPPGGLVLDPFAGSGSTLLTARSLGRRAIGIEADEKYCEAAARRLDELDLLAARGAP